MRVKQILITLFFGIILNEIFGCSRMPPRLPKVPKVGRPIGRLNRAKKFLNDNRKPIGALGVGLLQELLQTITEIINSDDPKKKGNCALISGFPVNNLLALLDGFFPIKCSYRKFAFQLNHEDFKMTTIFSKLEELANKKPINTICLEYDGKQEKIDKSNRSVGLILLVSIQDENTLKFQDC